MNYLTEKKFSFISKAVAEDTFAVVKFTGTESLSELYHFEILLISEQSNVDLDAVIQEPASFFIHRPDGSRVPFHGMIAECDLVRASGSYYLFRVILVPKVWQLTLTNHNQVFLNKTPQDIISTVLQDGGLTNLDFEFRLQGSYVTWEFACQYGETHFDFICRWMERNGIYYFFDQSGDREKLIMTDSKMSHVQSGFGNTLTYAPVSGLESLHLDESIQSYIYRRKHVPKKITLKDYDYRKPSLNVQGAAEVSSNGYGEKYYYGDHFRTPEEGNKIAKIRSEEFLCQAKQFHGESTVPYLSPGYTFSLQDHFNSQLNTEYLTISIEHNGNQTGFFISGIREHLSEGETQLAYRNTFTTIEKSVQFRRSRTTKRPLLHGTINGHIDASGSGQYAEVDDQGRYKVILPFDLSGRDGGKASAWVRMMQPYGGSDHGMHFPLHKGCEVLLTFIAGNPDRPVIAGAVANPENPSQVTSDSQTMAKLTTSGGNKIHMEDREGEQRILHQSPTASTWMRMGAPNDPPAAGDDEDEEHTIWNGKTKKTEGFHPHAESKGEYNEDGFALSSEGSFNCFLGMNYKLEVGGISNSTIIGGENKLIIGEEIGIVLGARTHAIWPWDNHFSPAHTKMHGEISKIHGLEQNVTTNRTNITANQQTIAADQTRITANEQAIVADQTRITANEQAIVADQTRITANEQAIVADQTRITANEQAIVADQTRITANEQAIVADKQEIAANKDEIAAAKTEIATEKTQINTLYDVLSGEVMLL